jgi:hypothetical protein
MNICANKMLKEKGQGSKEIAYTITRYNEDGSPSLSITLDPRK